MPVKLIIPIMFSIGITMHWYHQQEDQIAIASA